MTTRSTNEAWSVGCSRAGMWIRSNSAGGWATAFSRSTTPAWSGAKARTPRSAFWSRGGPPAVATIDQVRMVSLMTQDDRAARQFVLSTLGRLATEPSVLQRSLHAFLANGCNVTQTAEALGTHRNTLLRRLERAQDLLPVRLADHRIQIAAALELVIWSTPLIDDDK
ncbi:PucR family transcriptional regulator [Pseudomonas aeruginosa]|uniref:PucR family transcriptional regulator n=1 Tax=Pseudomonas aeruginosa TaxID=287 RepID=UPI0032614078